MAALLKERIEPSPHWNKERVSESSGQIKKICSFLAEKQCEFVFNAPGASNTGGVWERQIRTVCNILKAILLLCP